MSGQGPILPTHGGQSAENTEDEEDSEDEAMEKEAYFTWREEMEQALSDEGSLSYLSVESMTKEEEQSLLQWVSTGVLEQTVERDEPACIYLAAPLAHYHELGRNLEDDELIEIALMAEGQQQATIVKSFDILTPEEKHKHRSEIRKVKAKEIHGLHGLGCFSRKPKREAHNVIDIKWVIKWKMVKGIRSIHCRMTVRGFKDRDTNRIKK